MPDGSDVAAPANVLIVGLHLRWDGVWQRPHHLIRLLSSRIPVIVLEEPVLIGDDERDAVSSDAGVTIVRPLRRACGGPGRCSHVDERAIATLRRVAGERAAIVWLYTPMMLELADALAPVALVYDCMDELAAFKDPPPTIHARERRLLELADLVFAGGRSIYRARARLGPKVKCYPSGVEFEHFARAASGALAPHPVVRELERPIYGYYGVIDERIDLALVDALATRLPGNVVMVGPVTKIDPVTLPSRANIHYTGQMPYDTLPSFLAGFDVALMPFAMNGSTRSISPTKTLEYLAAGVPVVSTPVPDVVADYADVVAIADGLGAFTDACERAPATQAERRDEGRRRAQARSWTAIASAMWDDLAETLAHRDAAP